MNRLTVKPAASLAAVLAALLALSGCTDPLADVPRLSDVDVAGPVPVVEAVAAPEETSDKTGFFARLTRKREVAPETAVADVAANDAATDSAETAQPAPEAPKRGLFGFARRAPAAEATPPDATGDDAVQLASLRQSDAADVGQDATATETRARKGLFNRAKAGAVTGSAAGADLRAAVPGEVLRFGDVARACHVTKGQLGQQVAQYPERGAKYRVYDSAPGNLGLHTFYVTGFSDGCPRQFTAALAVFGTPSMYEALRYGLPEKARPKKPTDKAYETVKSRLCGVGRNRPCGARIGRLEKTTVFLSLYDRFEDAQGWSNLLLSEGEVVAKDIDG